MTHPPNLDEVRLAMLTSGLCMGFSISSTNYVETLNVRWQGLPQKLRGDSKLAKHGLDIIKKEGFVKGLWFPGCFTYASAGIISASVRIGCYPYFRDFIRPKDHAKSVVHMFPAAFVSGALGFALANPLFRAKLSIQAGLNNPKTPPRTTFMVLRDIYNTEGIKGLYKGSGVLMLRGAIVNSGQQLGYDFTKTFMLRQGIEDTPKVHFTSSICAALLTATFCTPTDFILARYNSGGYRNLLECAGDVFRRDGAKVFQAGWLALFVRFGTLFVINIPLYEQARRFAGLPYLK